MGYLVVTSIVLWSITTKLRTGSGLPAGPAGLLGAVEGLSWLSVVAGLCTAQPVAVWSGLKTLP